MEREAGRCIGGRRLSPLLCETQHWRREVDAHDLVTIRREGRGHPTSATPDLEDRSTCLPGQSPVEVGVALHGAARDEARAQGVIYLGVQAVGFVKGTELRLLAHGSSVGSNRYRVKAFGHRRRRRGRASSSREIRPYSARSVNLQRSTVEMQRCASKAAAINANLRGSRWWSVRSRCSVRTRSSLILRTNPCLRRRRESKPAVRVLHTSASTLKAAPIQSLILLAGPNEPIQPEEAATRPRGVRVEVHGSSG